MGAAVDPAVAPRPATVSVRPTGAVTVAFSPKGDAESLAVRAILAAQVSLKVQAYEFSSHPICDAIIAAHKRGVAVSVILDKANKPNPLSKWFSPVGKNSLYPALRDAGVPVMFDYRPPIAHNKVLIADSAVVVTGSFNFSSAAQSLNAENLLVIGDKTLAAAYLANFAWRYSLSRP